MINTLHAQNPAIRVFEDWSDTSGTQNDFQRTVVRSKAIGGTTYYYVCGATLNSSGDYDILTRKLDASGNELWTQTYSGSGNGDDFGADIQIDNVGNVYVCGLYYKDATDSTNAIILKYNAAGTYKWAYTYNGTGSRNDVFATMQVSANAVIAGGTTWKNSTNKYDFLMARLDSNGTQIWLNSWDYLNLNDAAVNVYNNGSKIYIAGGAQSATTTYKYAALNVRASDGAVLGNTVTGGTAFGIDQVTDLKVDVNQNIYITGSALDMSAMYDIRTIKLDTALNILWSHSYDGGTGANDFGSGVTIDQSGNVIVCGTSQTSSNGTNYVVLKYNSSGTLLWDETYNGTANGNDSATAVVVHPTDTNKIYVTGYSFNGSTKDYYTLKYDAAGTRKWEIGYNNIYNGDDRAFAITLDTTGNVIVTGQNKWNDSTYVYTTVKYVELEVTMHMDTTTCSTSISLFVQNRGQLFGTDSLPHNEIKFCTLFGSPTIYYSDTAVSYVIAKLDSTVSNNDSLIRVDMHFVHGTPQRKIFPLNRRIDYSNYFLGHINEGRSKVEHYSNLYTKDVWDNIDVFYGDGESNLKQYFVCKPTGGGNPAAQIKWKYSGADSISIDTGGCLIIHTKLGNIKFEKPKAWQLDSIGNYQSVNWQPDYHITGSNEIMFINLGVFNASLPLVLLMDQDNSINASCPSGVIWSTYIGGGNGFDQFHAVKTNANGDVFVAGETSSINFPHATGYQTALAGGMDAVVLKVFADGPLNWATYYGGNTNSLNAGGAADRAFSLDIDGNDNVYFVGMTESTDFPCNEWIGAYYDDILSSVVGVAIDQFIVKLSANGQTALWATYYGGNNNDQALSVAVSSTNGDIYIGGFGGSGFPTEFLSGAYNGTGTNGGTVVKFNYLGQIIWCSYLTSTDGGAIEALTVDINNDLLAVGRVAAASGFPIVNPGGNSTFGGGLADGFVTKFDGQTLGIEWSTFLGGDGYDVCTDVVSIVTSSNIKYFVVGSSSSTQTGPIPLAQPGLGEYYQPNLSGGSNSDGIIAQFNSAGILTWSTYMGGSGYDYFYGITADSDNNIFLTGLSYSADFPLPSTSLPNLYFEPTIAGNCDAIVLGFNQSANNYIWGTYFGGSWAENGWDIACSDNDRLYIVGQSGDPTNFPFCQGTQTPNGTPYYDDQPGIKGFISEFDLTPVILSSTPENFNNQDNLILFPNPANQTITIISTAGMFLNVINYRIMDNTGRIVNSSSNLDQIRTILEIAVWNCKHLIEYLFDRSRCIF